MKLILATTWPRRIEACQKLWIPFIAEGSNVDEHGPDRPTDPIKLTAYLAKVKAEAVAKSHTEGIVIGFDSVGLFEGKILEKPKTREEAFARLKSLSGKRYEYHTWLHLINLYTHTTLAETVMTEIFMRILDDNEINFYLDHCDEWYKMHAHGYSPENYYSMSFIERINGEPGILWIPISTTLALLKKIGYTM